MKCSELRDGRFRRSLTSSPVYYTRFLRVGLRTPGIDAWRKAKRAGLMACPLT